MKNNLNINKQLNDFAVYLKHSKSIIRQLRNTHPSYFGFKDDTRNYLNTKIT